VVRSVFGMLGLIGLFVATLLGLLATFGAFKEKPFAAYAGDTPAGSQPSGSEGTTAEGVDQFKQTAATIGETVTAGDLSWTVTDAHQTTEIDKQTPPPKTLSGSFVVVDFTVENISERPVTLTSDFLPLFSDRGRKFPPQSAANSGYVEDDKNILFNEESLLQPGETKEGEANFELPLNTSASVVQLGDNDPTVDEEKYVDLGL
jgi:hypothetical protein